MTVSVRASLVSLFIASSLLLSPTSTPPAVAGQPSQNLTQSYSLGSQSGARPSYRQLVNEYWTNDTHAQEALEVSWCESRHNQYAKNGEYLGYFQMGDGERATWDWGWPRRKQVRASHAYYRYLRARYGDGWRAWPGCHP